MDRDAARQAFLAEAGFGAAVQDPLPVDCSFRSYVRLHQGPQPALLMNAPPGLEPLHPFVDIARHLRGLGLSAPAVSAADAGLRERRTAFHRGSEPPRVSRYVAEALRRANHWPW